MIRSEESGIKVSVIIPLYNTPTYIRKCIESCLNQTLKEIEIIVINDGSTDESPDIVKEYIGKNNNILMHSIENSGLSIARNSGLAMAKGKYIYFLDSDDWIDEDCLEILYTQAEKYHLELVTFDSQNVGEVDLYSSRVGVISRFDILDASRIYTGKEFVAEYQDRQGVVEAAWIFFIRRSFLQANEIQFLPHVIYEDHKFHFDLLMSANRIMYLPKALHKRTCHANSIMTSGFSDRKFISIYETALAILCAIERKNLNSEETRFWLSYAQYRLKYSIMVINNISGQDYARVLERCYPQIEELQYQCMLKHYELLKRVDFPDFTKFISAQLIYMEQLLGGIGVISPRQIAFLSEVDQFRDDYIREKLEKLPFSEEGKRIGIFGVGNHTRNVLREYQRLIGDIRCDILYIDSYIPSYTQRIEWRDIVNVHDVTCDDVDGIVISSYLYQKDMLESLRRVVGDTLPIYTIYDNGDWPLDTDYNEVVDMKKRLMRFKRNCSEKRIFVIGTPRHTNTGDYLITFGVRQFLNTYFSGCEIIEVTGEDFQANKDNVWDLIAKTDLILIDGGGFFGSYWMDGTTIQMALEIFPHNPTVILPQTLFYEDNRYGKIKADKICEVIEKHENLTICYRETNSLKKGQVMFGEKVRQYALPDMALLLHGLKREKQRNGILLCLRKDIESVFTEAQRKQIAGLAEQLRDLVSSTSMHWENVIAQEEETEIINRKLDELGTAELVITDALHCMVSCALIGVPCIALPSTTQKTAGVYEWIKELEYIRYVEDIADIEDAAKKLLYDRKQKDFEYVIDTQEYEAKLAEILSKSWGIPV